MDIIANEPTYIRRGTLPEPPPPYSYESLSLSWSIDGSGQATQTGLNIRFLEEMDQMAHWLHSWDVSLLSTSRKEEVGEAVIQVSHLFHWRISTRFLVNMGPLFQSGLRGFGDDVTYFSGVGGYAGFTALPEGWTKIPLDISVNYRYPLTLYDTRFGGFQERPFTRKVIGSRLLWDWHFFVISSINFQESCPTIRLASNCFDLK